MGWPCPSKGQGGTSATNGRFRGAMAAARLSATPRAMPPINRIAIMDTRRTHQARRALLSRRALSVRYRVGYEVFHTTVFPSPARAKYPARLDDASHARQRLSWHCRKEAREVDRRKGLGKGEAGSLHTTVGRSHARTPQPLAV
jgi:hypothetical protein